MNRYLAAAACTAAAALALQADTTVSVFTEQGAGQLNQKLNGGNGAPPLYVERKPCMNFRRQFEAMRLPITRLHDSSWNPNSRLVDVPMIFANFKADAENPDNYYFDQTDDYIRKCIEGGTQILYRLGPSIEWTERSYFAKPPEDPAKWASICAHIIRHYNDGWNNGFRFNIQYWEIWNEPDVGSAMWTGTHDEFIDFYIKVAAILKVQCPNVKIGGPAHCTANSAEPFLRRVSAARAPLDFYSWHCYSGAIEPMIGQVRHIRKLLDRYGFAKAETVFDEWHWFPFDWGEFYSTPEKHREICNNRLNGLDAGAFATALMTAWQDEPLDMSCYYWTMPGNWGPITGEGVITPSHYALVAYGRLMAFPERIKASASAPVYALAGRNAKGEVAVLVSGFRSHAGKIVVKLDRVPKSVEALAVDDGKSLEAVPAVCEAQAVTLVQKGDSAVFLLKLAF